jgi:hypothetical protein
MNLIWDWLFTANNKMEPKDKDTVIWKLLSAKVIEGFMEMWVPMPS